jgi:hypothetical protein
VRQLKTTIKLKIMTLEILQNKLWELQTSSMGDLEKKYWTNISIAITAIQHSIEKFNTETDGQIAIGYAKLCIMELWTIRELLLCLNKSTTTDFDILIPRLKDFRDAYAHLKERIQGIEKKFHQPKTQINWETRNIANGKITSDDGINWNMNCSRSFNLSFSGQYGAMVIFDLADNYVICNTSCGVIEMELNQTLFQEIIKVIDTKTR